MTNSHPHNPPRPKQLRLLRILAEETGSSFAYPKNFDQASEEIGRMKKLKKTDYADRRRERRQISADMSSRRGGSSSVGDHELSGYGSNCRWLHQTRD